MSIYPSTYRKLLPHWAMRFAFFLGLIQLMVAHFMAFLKKEFARTSTGEYGKDAEDQENGGSIFSV